MARKRGALGRRQEPDHGRHRLRGLPLQNSPLGSPSRFPSRLPLQASPPGSPPDSPPGSPSKFPSRLSLQAPSPHLPSRLPSRLPLQVPPQDSPSRLPLQAPFGCTLVPDRLRGSSLMAGHSEPRDPDVSQVSLSRRSGTVRCHRKRRLRQSDSERQAGGCQGPARREDAEFLLNG